jgi:hypothetical protein
LISSAGDLSLTEEFPDFWHTKYQDVKLPVFSALPGTTLS